MKNKILDEIFSNTSSCTDFFLIEASAGTGKTYTMEHIFTEFVIQGISIQSILAVTFTEKAATELSLRIYENLKNREQDNDYVKTALRDFQQNSIFTIHGFANKIIHEFRVLTGISGTSELIDRNKVLNHVFNLMIRDKEIAQDALLADILKTISIDDLETIFIRMSEQKERLTAGNCANPEFNVTQFLLKYIDNFNSRVSRYIKDGVFFTYDDMIEVVADLLNKKDNPLLKALRSRYSIGIIDEFQDTDSKQWDIFRNIFCSDRFLSKRIETDYSECQNERHFKNTTLSHFSGSGLDESTGKKLFLVGDPKQSIYGWRGADLDTYFNAKSLITQKNGKLLSLDTSFRSTGSMVDAVNTFFTSFFTRPNDYPGNIKCGNPCMKLDSSKSQVELKSINVPVFKSVDKNPLLNAFTNELSRLLSGEYYFEKNSIRKRITPGDIFFLVRTTNDANDVEKLLREKNIPCFIYKNSGLFQSFEALGVLDVLRAVLNPDPANLRKALITDFFRMPLSAVLADNPDEEYEKNAETIKQWGILAKERRISVLFHELIEKKDFVEWMFKGNKKHLLENYHTIIETLLIQNPSSTLESHIKTLEKFYVEDYRNSDEDINITENSNISDSVQILTIHKSKGLENKIIFLYGGIMQRGGGSLLKYFKDKNNNIKWWIADKTEENKEKFSKLKAEEEEFLKLEKQRLSYVAFTRASAALFVPLILNKDGKPRKVPLNDLNNRLSELYTKKPQNFRFYPINITSDENSTLKFEKTESEQLIEPPPMPDFPDLKNRLGENVNSYSSLKKFFTHNNSFDIHSFQRGEEDRGSVFGTLVHEFMEKIDIKGIMNSQSFESWTLSEDVQILSAQLTTGKKWMPETIKKALSMCYNGYKTPVFLGNTSLALGNALQIRREMEFLNIYEDSFPEFSGILKKGDLIKGIIDIAFVHEGKLWLGDWKTDFRDDYSKSELQKIVSEEYDIQKKLYKNAANLMFNRFRNGAFGGIIYIFLRGLDEYGNGVWIDEHNTDS